ncbi:MAG: hypothetical protein K2K15_01385 [Anaeroplasmataceae bacterium]|nr:hypothetical protein [Anaeroplasmataceae bacterium]
MKHLKRFVIVLFALLALSLTGCADKKSPMSGYLSEEELASIIEGFDGSLEYDEIEIAGSINYFNLSVDKMVNTVDQVMTYQAYPLKSEGSNDYLKNCASYYLRLPLQLTKDSWNETDTNWSTRYQLESKVYRPAGMDKLYYYKRAEGGFILRLFGVNKELKISNYDLWENGNVDDLVDLLCSGKWNITVEYDANGFLVSETFETVNAPKNKDKASKDTKSKCCYGQATYTYL